MKKMMMASCALAWSILCGAMAQTVQTVEGLPQHAVPESVLAAEQAQPARHVILMIGDGMGPEHAWAAWACNGGRLNLHRLPVCGWSRTSSASHAITDSAAGGTAIACGQRTANYTVGQSPAGEPFGSVADDLHAQGYATGLVVTKSIADATPAAFYAHVSSRYNTARIAEQLGESAFRVILGGGAQHVPAETVEALRARGVLIELAAPLDLPPASQRGDYLPQAVERALAVLGQGGHPFFLMVEGSQIDSASHASDLREMVAEVLEFDRALGVVLQWAEAHPGTLVVVTADHQTGSLSLLDADMVAGRVSGAFSTHRHSGLAVPLYAGGAGAGYFSGVFDNRSIRARIRQACASRAGEQKDTNER